MVYASRMKARHAFLAGLGLVWGGSVGFIACGGSGGFSGDGGPDGAPEATMFDVPKVDNTQPDVGPTPEGGGFDTGPADSGLTGHCSPVNGACDMVLQNCPKNQECVVITDTTAESGLGATTMCQPTQSSEHLPIGSFCCPGETNYCDPGTTCQGDPCLGDGGAGGGGGSCTPACCPADGGTNNQNCGTSPSGYIGVCDLSLSGGSGTLYEACTYESTCTIFVKPCGPGYTCLVQDMSGTSKCTVIDEVDGSTSGLSSGSTCAYDNVCAPGLECVTFPYSDGGLPPNGSCTYLCYTKTGSPPFDAGVLTTAPGMGGCPMGSSCSGASFLPTWLGVCAP
jgi:hypothetical protein